MKNLFKALANFQQEVPVIHKGTKGYGYSYSDLPAIFSVINPLLKKHKLGFTQLVEGISIKTIIFHTESGETLESLTDIPQGVQLKGMNDFQVLGSAITYIRRYALSSALGLVTDKDTDAAGQQKPKQQPKPAPEKEQGHEQAFINRIKKEGGLTTGAAGAIQKARSLWGDAKTMELLSQAGWGDDKVQEAWKS
jgi:hypothetical protein